MKDYGVYLNVKSLYSCQKILKICNRDEFNFNCTPLSWMKLIVYTFLIFQILLKKKYNKSLKSF